jgi:hypothetical protein
MEKNAVKDFEELTHGTYMVYPGSHNVSERSYRVLERNQGVKVVAKTVAMQYFDFRICTMYSK